MELIKDPAEEIIKMHLECMLSVKSSLSLAIDIGERLAEQKEAMDHGEFTPWIEANLPFTVRTAQNYLKLFIKKDVLLSANLDSIAEAYLLLAPKEDESDVHIHKNPVKDDDYQASHYQYWDHLKPLIEKMEKIHERLSALRDGTTPKGLGYMIGNIKDMANVLESWSPDELEDCPDCKAGECGNCLAGKIGMYQESEF